MEAALFLWQARSRRFRRGPATRAVAENGPDAHAVRQWLDTIVIGLGLCPWAAPAADAGQVRIVTSTAKDELGVLADLRAEALRLPVGQPRADAATTTLLACPRVAAWRSAAAFQAFYQERLANGYALAARGIYVVPFHPCHGGHVEGEAVELADAGAARASIPDGGGGRELLVGSPPAAGPSAAAAAEAAAEASALASRAPRPVLHLLRTIDLERACEDPGLRERNRRTAEALGVEGAARLLLRCG